MIMFWCPVAGHKRFLLCLIEVVGPSVVNIMAESSSNHGKGIEVRVVLLQLTSLLRRKRINSSVASKISLKQQEKKVFGVRTRPYKEQRKHCLSHIEAVSPVVIGDVAVSLADRIHPSCQGLHGGREEGEKSLAAK